MAKLTLADVSNILGNPTSAANTINANNTLIETALENTLSRDGTTPNQMTADIDMNNNDIINVDNLDANNIILDGAVLVPGEVQAAQIASQAEAEAGVDNTKIMTSLRVKQSLAVENFDASRITTGTLPVVRGGTGTTTSTGSGSVVLSASPTFTGQPVIPGLPNLATDVQGVGVPGLNGGHWFIYNAQSSFDDAPTLRVDRNITGGTGVAGNTYKTFWALNYTPPASQGYEWTVTAEQHNRTSGTTLSQNVALNGTVFLEANGVSEIGKSWGANLVVDDRESVVNPTYGRVGVEVNNYALKTGGTDANRQRVGIQIAVGSTNGNPDPGTPLHIGRGILVGANDANVIIDRLMEVSGGGTYDIGIDTTAATFAKPVLMMKEGHRIGFDGTTGGAFNRSLRYSTGSLIYSTQNGDVFFISDTGAMNTNGTISILGTQVVTARRTGWTAATGTATRTTFDTSTVTTAQLAERVKALIDDLITHGLIGA